MAEQTDTVGWVRVAAPQMVARGSLMTIVLAFPGQSSRYPGMLSKAAAICPSASVILRTAEDVLGRDLLAADAAGAPATELFASNSDIQLRVFLTNHLWLQALTDAGVRASFSLGLSLGEYNHLVHIGALSFTEALRLVQARGEAYDSGPRGMMAVVQPVGPEELNEILEPLRAHGVIEIVNLNSPKQQVVAGETAVVELAIKTLEDEHYLQPIVIERQIAMHSSLFQSVAELFEKHLRRANFKTPTLPYLPNRLGRGLNAPKEEDFRTLLAQHIHHPVLFKKSIDWLGEAVEAPMAVIEVGAMSVLCNLLKKKWCKAEKFSVDAREDARGHFFKTVEKVKELGLGIQ